MARFDPAHHPREKTKKGGSSDQNDISSGKQPNISERANPDSTGGEATSAVAKPAKDDATLARMAENRSNQGGGSIEQPSRESSGGGMLSEG